MSTSLVSAWKKNIFSNPFFASCENSNQTPGLEVNVDRTIAAASSGLEETVSPELSESVAEPVWLPESAAEPTTLNESAAEPAPFPEAVVESISFSESVAEPISQPESVAEPISLPEVISEPASLPELIPEPVALSQSIDEPAPLQESMAEPISLPESVTEPMFLPESAAEPAIQTESFEPISLPESADERVAESIGNLPESFAEPVAVLPEPVSELGTLPTSDSALLTEPVAEPPAEPAPPPPVVIPESKPLPKRVVLPAYVKQKALSISRSSCLPPLDRNGVPMVSLTTIPCGSSVTNRRWEEHSCEFGSAKYYGLCAFGGLLSCGLTHTAVVPLDLVKCRIQVDAAKYGNIINGFRVTLAEEGVRALGKGWAPTLIGYSMQGVGKFGFYEAFKILYSGMLGEENTFLWRTSLYLAASASAEFFADIALCPMEAVKVRIQTQPGWSTTLREGFPRILQEEGVSGFYKGLVPLWARQIPYTMMKFACFERTVEALYKYVVPKPRSECSKPEQLVVTFAAGYIAGVFCAIVSHPADTIVSKLNQDKGSNFVQIAQRLGFMGMWKGLFPRIIMIGTLTALQWFIYDSVKVAFRLPRPPPPEMPESLKKKMGLA